jgi:glycosyltransferase involved in cell wall biosynthesis
VDAVALVRAPLPITVVIPAYERATTLPRALGSIAAQRPARPAEVIVIDDASSDETSELARRLGATVIRHAVNGGTAAARNSGIAAASHEWIALLDSDDEWLPHHLATLWPLRAGHDFVAGSAVHMNAGRPRFDGPLSTAVRLLTRADELLFPECFVPVSATLLRRDAVLAAGGYDTSLPMAEDLDLLVRLVQRGSAVSVPAVIAIWHDGPDQMTRDRRAVRDAHLAVARRHSGSPSVVRRCRAAALWDDARGLPTRRERRRARRALARDPRHLPGLMRLLLHRRRVRLRTARLGLRA